MDEYAITQLRLRRLHRLEKVLGVKFNDINLLNLALIHASFSHDLGTTLNNERLEFLGDAVLELASSSYLYKNFPELSEGDLTKTRASIVCQPSLSKLARRLNLGEYMLFGPSEMSNGGKDRDSNLEDAFEAIIGAIYIDRGWDAARDYVTRQFATEFERVKTEGIHLDYKTTLQEYIQKEHNGSKIEYLEISATGPPHQRVFECAVDIDGVRFGEGIGKSKKLAEQQAAKVALTKYDIEV